MTERHDDNQLNQNGGEPDPAEDQAAASQGETGGNAGENPEVGEENENLGQQSDEADASSITDEELQALIDGEEQSAAEKLAQERLDDLLRLQAEYANYRKRVERDRVAVQQTALADTLQLLLPILDDLDRAEQHGDLKEGPFAVIGQKIRSTLEKKGLEKFGAVGEEFDPNQHEAIARLPKPDAQGETVADVVEPGYRIGERLLRPAKVAVAVPTDP